MGPKSPPSTIVYDVSRIGIQESHCGKKVIRWEVIKNKKFRKSRVKDMLQNFRRL